MEGASLITHNYQQTKSGSPEAAFAWTKGGAIVLELKVKEEG